MSSYFTIAANIQCKIRRRIDPSKSRSSIGGHSGFERCIKFSISFSLSGIDSAW